MHRLPYKVRSAIIITTTGTLTFFGLNIVQGNEKFYSQFVMPIVHKLFDAEDAHLLAIKFAKNSFVPDMSKNQIDDDCLKVRVFNKQFQNPIGCAAGFDKNGEAMNGLFKLGFGFVEVGTVTPEPQSGNAKPRVFRLLQDRAIINRYGFNSDGYLKVFDRIKEFKADDRNEMKIVGINIGKNKESKSAIDDYAKGLSLFSSHADYLVINISSPNTPGLRNLQKKSELEILIEKLLIERNKCNKNLPILIKIAPDLTDSEINDIANTVNKFNKNKNEKIDGIIISNTTVSRPDSLVSSEYINETGGLSGKPLKSMSNELIKKIYSLTNGNVTIIGVGGVESGLDAFEKIKCGASLVQLYTALAYDGPPLINKIKKELSILLKNEGFSCVEQAVGYYNK